MPAKAELSTQKSLFLQAFEGNSSVTPVWFMRQAGRYLPQYRVLREKHSLRDLFSTPDIAAKITCMPVHILGVDAAILFADILTLPANMGFQIEFHDQKGPLIAPFQDFDKIHDLGDLAYLKTTIQLVKQELPPAVPLIGFAGSPFTVLTYLIEGGSSVNFNRTLRFIYQRPNDFDRLMTLLTKNTIHYLQFQKASGVDVCQLFDTWAGILRPADYARLVLPYLKKIFSAVQLPSIYYVKNCAHLLTFMDQTDADFLSVCHTVELGHHTEIAKTKKGIQGNLFNGLLYADEGTLEREVKNVLAGGRKHGRYIFNLSHGVFPDVNVDKLKLIVDTVHNFQ